MDCDLRKNEESLGTLAHPGLWGWLRPCMIFSGCHHYHCVIIHSLCITGVRILKLEITDITPVLNHTYTGESKQKFLAKEVPFYMFYSWIISLIVMNQDFLPPDTPDTLFCKLHDQGHFPFPTSGSFIFCSAGVNENENRLYFWALHYDGPVTPHTNGLRSRATILRVESLFVNADWDYHVWCKI